MSPAITVEALADATGGRSDLATVGVLWFSAGASAVVDNIPYTATAIPVVEGLIASGLQPESLWWALALGACLGGNGTLIGASANLTVAGIAERNGIPFRFLTYAKLAFPLMVIHVAICHVYLLWRYI